MVRKSLQRAVPDFDKEECQAAARNAGFRMGAQGRYRILDIGERGPKPPSQTDPAHSCFGGPTRINAVLGNHAGATDFFELTKQP